MIFRSLCLARAGDPIGAVLKGQAVTLAAARHPRTVSAILAGSRVRGRGYEQAGADIAARALPDPDAAGVALPENGGLTACGVPVFGFACANDAIAA